jgi:hypothetical protein
MFDGNLGESDRVGPLKPTVAHDGPEKLTKQTPHGLVYPDIKIWELGRRQRWMKVGSAVKL